MKKQVFAAGLAGAALILAVGAFFLKPSPQKQEEEKKTLRIGITLYRGDDPFINNLRSKLEEKAKRYEIATGIKIVLEVADPKDNQNTQNNQVDRFLSLGYDAICVNMVDRSAAS